MERGNVFKCEMCAFQSASRIATVQHTVRHHRFEGSFLATCRFPNCEASYHNWKSYKSHVARKHRDILVEEPMPEPVQELGMNEAGNADLDIAADQPEVPEAFHEENPLGNEIRSQYVKYIQHIRESCNISQLATDRVADGIVQFSDDTLRALRDQLLNSANQDGMIPTDSINEIMNDFTLANAIDDVNSKYKLDKFLVENGFLIMPKSILLDTVWVWEKKPRLHLTRKPIQFQEVPFIPTLEKLLSQDDVLRCVENPRPPSEDGILKDYSDGVWVKTHPIFGNDSKSLKIILYYDEVEIVNPLGSKVKTHKLAMFYWTLISQCY